MRTLKKSYHKAFFTLIKAYKRYYFGAQLLKIPFYKLISKQTKLAKWQEKREQRREFLREALNGFKSAKHLYKTFHKESEKWLNSQEFKEKYLDTKHPFPPLLNPDKIDYNAIPAEIAWEWNLPLPPNYDFFYITNGSSASAATHRFLEECNLRSGLMKSPRCPKGVFMRHFDIFKMNTSNNIFACWSGILGYFDSDFFIYRFTKKVPLLYVARDPIEKLQHTINHIDGEGYMGNIANINLTCNYINVGFTRQSYDSNVLPTMKSLCYSSNIMEDYGYSKFMLDSLLKMMKSKISSIHIIEFDDLKPDKAFDTFCKIADTLGFERPKNKEIFTNRINRNRGALITLPTTLYVHNDDLQNVFDGKNEGQNLDSLSKSGGFNIIITLPHYLNEAQKNYADITEQIEPNLIIDDTKVLIIIDKNELKKLKENAPLFEAAKGYLKGYVEALKQNAAELKANYISEEQILEHLRENKDLRLKIKEILDNELNYIKQNHPEFIQKWKYYLEFEKMCAELDGVQNKGEK